MDKTYTLINTENCNLRCAYCFEHTKRNKTMSNEVIDKIKDFVVDDVSDLDNCSRVIIDIIGGEPFYNLDSIKYIYSAFSSSDIKKPIIFHITTNGTMFTPEAKEFLESIPPCKISVGISLDGIKECHDKFRSNSFDTVMKDFSWWKEHFPNNTIKSTLTTDNVKYYFENVKFIHSLGINDITITHAFECEWDEEHLAIFREQLTKTSDYLLSLPKNLRPKIWQFSDNILRRRECNQCWCGTGRYMTAFDADGNIYPCHRFSATNLRPSLIIGNVDSGLDYNRLRPFIYSCIENMDKKECLTCEANNICSMCLAYNYDVNGSILKRSANTCEMVKVIYQVSMDYHNKLRERL